MLHFWFLLNSRVKSGIGGTTSSSEGGFGAVSEVIFLDVEVEVEVVAVLDGPGLLDEPLMTAAAAVVVVVVI